MPNDLDPDVVQLAKDVVGTMAPAELPLFNTLSREYARDPDRALKAGAGQDEVLGFGVELGLLLTPAVIAVAETVIKFVAAEILKIGQQAAGTAVDSTVHELVSRAVSGSSAKAANHATFSAEQLAEVRKIALGRALSLHLDRDQADRLADAMVARLATAV